MSAKTKTPTPKPASQKPPAKKRGNLKPGEIRPLIMAARKAFDIQEKFGNVEPGQTFDTWRKAQCLEAVDRAGITACYHEDFRPLLAHFQTLAGDDGSAFASLMKSGKPTDRAEAGDTHEARRQLAHNIAEILNAHMHLATTAEDVLLAEASAGGITAAEFRAMLDRKVAIDLKGKGPLTVGYVVYLVRQKTRRPNLSLGGDWQAGLAERCTVRQLTQIRDTLVNRIAAVEGVGRSEDRNKSQRTPKAESARYSNRVMPR